MLFLKKHEIYSNVIQIGALFGCFVGILTIGHAIFIMRLPVSPEDALKWVAFSTGGCGLTASIGVWIGERLQKKEKTGKE